MYLITDCITGSDDDGPSDKVYADWKILLSVGRGVGGVPRTLRMLVDNEMLHTSYER